jgi:NADH:ubiquinone oxidoreductase subunit K
MMELSYLAGLAVAVVGIALAGMASNRHFIVIMLGVELIFAACTVLLVSFFTASQPANPQAVIMLLSIWAVAAAEIMVMVVLYVYMKSEGVSFDTSKLTRMKW